MLRLGKTEEELRAAVSPYQWRELLAYDAVWGWGRHIDISPPIVQPPSQDAMQGMLRVMSGAIGGDKRPDSLNRKPRIKHGETRRRG